MNYRSCLPEGRNFAKLAIGLAAGLASMPAEGGGRATQTTLVVVNVSHSCRLSTNMLNFGMAAPNANVVRATTELRVNCTPGASYAVGIDNGEQWDGSTRRMHNDQANGKRFYADYQLYRDPQYLLPWGTGSNAVLGSLPPSGSQTLTIYGQANIAKVKSGPYRDTVTVILDF